MPHKLLRLSQSLYNTPHLITAQAFEPIKQYLNKRNDIGAYSIVPLAPLDKSPEESEDDEEGKSDEPIVEGIAEVCIDGALTYKPVEGMCGDVGCSYMGLLDEVEDLIEMGAKTIIFNFSSGGGQASHAFSTANDLRAMLDENGVKSYAYIDELAASAAYALAVVCDELIIHPSASAGSIGCLIALRQLDEEDAAETIFITSAEGKIPYDKAGKFTKDFKDDMQAEVDRLGAEFVQHVATYTGLSTALIKSTDAKCFNAEKSLSLGLVNSIMDHKQFAQYITRN